MVLVSFKDTDEPLEMVRFMIGVPIEPMVMIWLSNETMVKNLRSIKYGRSARFAIEDRRSALIAVVANRFVVVAQLAIGVEVVAVVWLAIVNRR
jgi:hypothetical protein